eukprot:tig00001292_g8058.t1
MAEPEPCEHSQQEAPGAASPPPAEPEAPRPPQQSATDRGSLDCTFKIKRESKLNKLFDAYCQRMKKSRCCTVFMTSQGVRLLDWLAPADYNLQDQDTLVARQALNLVKGPERLESSLLSRLDAFWRTLPVRERANVARVESRHALVMELLRADVQTPNCIDWLEYALDSLPVMDETEHPCGVLNKGRPLPASPPPLRRDALPQIAPPLVYSGDDTVGRLMQEEIDLRLTARCYYTGGKPRPPVLLHAQQQEAGAGRRSEALPWNATWDFDPAAFIPSVNLAPTGKAAPLVGELTVHVVPKGGKGPAQNSFALAPWCAGFRWSVTAGELRTALLSGDRPMGLLAGDTVALQLQALAVAAPDGVTYGLGCQGADRTARLIRAQGDEDPTWELHFEAEPPRLYFHVGSVDNHLVTFDRGRFEVRHALNVSGYFPHAPQLRTRFYHTLEGQDLLEALGGLEAGSGRPLPSAPRPPPPSSAPAVPPPPGSRLGGSPALVLPLRSLMQGPRGEAGAGECEAPFLRLHAAGRRAILADAARAATELQQCQLAPASELEEGAAEYARLLPRARALAADVQKAVEGLAAACAAAAPGPMARGAFGCARQLAAEVVAGRVEGPGRPMFAFVDLYALLSRHVEALSPEAPPAPSGGWPQPTSTQVSSGAYPPGLSAALRPGLAPPPASPRACRRSSRTCSGRSTRRGAPAPTSASRTGSSTTPSATRGGAGHPPPRPRPAPPLTVPQVARLRAAVEARSPAPVVAGPDPAPPYFPMDGGPPEEPVSAAGNVPLDSIVYLAHNWLLEHPEHAEEAVAEMAQWRALLDHCLTVARSMVSLCHLRYRLFALRRVSTDACRLVGWNRRLVVARACDVFTERLREAFEQHTADLQRELLEEASGDAQRKKKKAARKRAQAAPRARSQGRPSPPPRGRPSRAASAPATAPAPGASGPEENGGAGRSRASGGERSASSSASGSKAAASGRRRRRGPRGRGKGAGTGAGRGGRGS